MRVLANETGRDQEAGRIGVLANMRAREDRIANRRARWERLREFPVADH